MYWSNTDCIQRRHSDLILNTFTTSDLRSVGGLTRETEPWTKPSYHNSILLDVVNTTCTKTVITRQNIVGVV